MRAILPLCILLLAGISVCAQPRKKGGMASKPNQQNKFLEKQWWLGFKAGINLAEAVPTQRYAVITPVNYSQGLNDKAYDSFNKVGSQATLEATFYYKGFSFSTQPTYRQSRFTYSNQFQWDNPEDVDERLVLTYDQEQKLDYADFPLVVKYDILRDKFRPYVQLGIQYSLLVNGNKSVTVSGTDYASGGTNSFSNEPITVGAKDLFANYWGLMAGVGLEYNLGNVRVVLDAVYHKGMSNITNTENRYGSDRLSGIGDAQDDMKLNTITTSLGVLFPMRFLSSSFKTLDR